MSDLLLTARARQIIAEVAGCYRVSIKDLNGDVRDPVLVRARHVSAFILRRTLGLSYPAIGRLLHKDHTSVMHAVWAVGHDERKRKDAERILEGFDSQLAPEPLSLADEALQRFLVELDQKIAQAQALRLALGTHLMVSA